MKRTALLLFAVTLGSSCASFRENTVSLVAIGGAVVAAPVMLPAGQVANLIAGPSRVLMVHRVYRLEENTILIPNTVGWFTDHSEERAENGLWSSLSAWVVDLDTSPRDKKGRIILSDANLDRWYFRDNDVDGLVSIPKDPQDQADEYFVSGRKLKDFTLYPSDGTEIVFALSQERDLNDVEIS